VGERKENPRRVSCLSHFEKDLSHATHFIYCKKGHYAGQYPKKKVKQ
jgi:hypothetical protein